MSFPALSCEFASVDVSDALGTKRVNLTKTVRRAPVDLDLSAAGEELVDHPHDRPDSHHHGHGRGGSGGGAGGGKGGGPKYDDEDRWWEGLDVTAPLTRANFEATLGRYPIVVVVRFDFGAGWAAVAVLGAVMAAVLFFGGGVVLPAALWPSCAVLLRSAALRRAAAVFRPTKRRPIQTKKCQHQNTNTTPTHLSTELLRALVPLVPAPRARVGGRDQGGPRKVPRGQRRAHPLC